jgi:hypothetical protein
VAWGVAAGRVDSISGFGAITTDAGVSTGVKVGTGVGVGAEVSIKVGVD